MLKKCAVILYPVSNKVWARVPADEFDRNSEVSGNDSEQQLLHGEVRIIVYMIPFAISKQSYIF